MFVCGYFFLKGFYRNIIIYNSNDGLNKIRLNRFEVE